MNTIVDKEFIVHLAQDMIRIPTINPPGQHYHRFVDSIIPVLRQIGLVVEVINYETNYPIIYAHFNKGVHPEIHFNGHYDVVPVQGDWSHNPFDAVIENDRIYGRGAADMKGGIASILGAVSAVMRLKDELKGCISLSLVPDEETGGAFGTKSLISLTDLNPDAVIIPEPSYPRILLGHKGVVQVFVESVGKTSHAAMPIFGKNAFEQMVRLADSMIVHWLIADGTINSDIRKLYGSGTDPLMLPTMTLGGISTSGKAINSVPEMARFSIDRRFLPCESAKEVFNEIRNFVTAHGDEYRIVEVQVADASITPRHVALPLLSYLQSTILKFNGSLAPETISAGYDDTRYFRSVGNRPCLTYGPGNSGTAHIQDEYVEIQTMVNVSAIFVDMMLRMLSKA